jgi:chitinase
VPFYGHAWGDVPDVSHGAFNPGKPPTAHVYARYGDIVSTMLNQGYVRYWDAASSVPYLYNPDTKVFVSYEDPESLAKKCSYILDHKLAGVMFWDYAGDPTGALLNALDTGLNQGHP